MKDSFGARRQLTVGDDTFQVARLDALAGIGDIATLPYSLKVLLENLLRHEDGDRVTAEDVEALARWRPGAQPAREVSFSPARILMQDFTGVPCVVDLAAMREAVMDLGAASSLVEPQVPAELVIDHSIVADEYGTAEAFQHNGELEFERNVERYDFLRWGQQAFDDLLVVPPNTGICHQVNLEYLARVVFRDDSGWAYPDTLVGTDSHTPMVNGLGVLGWGVGGIEAEAAMLRQPVSMLTPQVVGFALTGELPEGSTATDLVLRVTEMLRQYGVVGKFVEFHGDGVGAVSVPDRATLGNMSPEYGSTCSIFPIDDETLRYLRFTGRDEEQVALVEAYAKEQGLWHDPTVTAAYDDHLELDLGTVRPSLAGPSRPQDRVPLDDAAPAFRRALAEYLDRGRTGRTNPPRSGMPDEGQPVNVRTGTNEDAVEATFPASDPVTPDPRAREEERRHDAEPPAPVDTDGIVISTVPVDGEDGRYDLSDGAVVIAAITSCTNTSNPSVMVAAGLLAKRAVERGLQVPPWVKTTLAPGSKVVTDYYDAAGLTPFLEKLGFYLAGYGCTTCIGNSGPLRPEISAAVEEGELAVAAVLSGNRNFEGRINPDVRMNYLASPPLVVAYALAGSLDVDLTRDPLGHDPEGEPVHLRDIWPTSTEVAEVIASSLRSEMFTTTYDHILEGDERWNGLDTPPGDQFDWEETSTYIRRPPFFDGLTAEPAAITDIVGARALAVLGDSVTTDHISPAGVIREDSPAGVWLREHGVAPEDFNSYGSRRGNHEVMIRGTFGNIRLRNRLAPGTEGPWTAHLPDGEVTSIYDAAQRYRDEGVPLVVLAGKEYGSGSSRDWAAKGTALLGVRAVIAESYERIHRSNLIGMGVLPLQYRSGESAEDLGLTGHETFTVEGLEGDELADEVTVRADDREFRALVRIDTPAEADYYRHGGILPYVVRRLVAES